MLTPLAVDPAHPFPYISGLSLNLAVLLSNPNTGKEHFARVKVPPLLPAVRQAGRASGSCPLEDVIAAHLDQLFPGMEVLQHHTFRVTRNEDVEVEEDDAENLLKALEKELLRRRFGPPVRLEVEETSTRTCSSCWCRSSTSRRRRSSSCPGPLDLTGLHGIADLDRAELQYPRSSRRPRRQLAEVERASPADMFRHPPARRAAAPPVRLVRHHRAAASCEQAAADPQVLAIKQTLYRTSGDSPIVDALIDAAEAGKQVLALVEIKARFDEQANISWARKLEQAGCHVVYGVVGLKTHCKLSLVVREEADGLRRYSHIGTGNYNPKTARLYEDLGLLTTNIRVSEDIARLFNHLSGYAPSATTAAAGRAALRPYRPGRAHRARDQAPPGRASRPGSGSRSTRWSTRR